METTPLRPNQECGEEIEQPPVLKNVVFATNIKFHPKSKEEELNQIETFTEQCLNLFGSILIH